jgi:dUTP pyrophosphatase
MADRQEVVSVPVLRAKGTEDLGLPEYLTAGAAGVDLKAAVDDPIVIPAGAIQVISTGLFVAVPLGFEGQIRPRSGLAVTEYVTLPNSPATIDSDYRGEIRVPLYNFGTNAFTVQRGMRIAQMVVVAIPRISWTRVEELDDTKRGGSGFGHTGR